MKIINKERQYYKLLRKILKRERQEHIIKQFKQSPTITTILFKRNKP